MVSAVDFFRQIKGLILALVKAQTRIRFEIFKGERLSARERVALCEEDVCAASEEFSKIQIVLVEDLHENIPVEIVQIEDTELALVAPDIFNDLCCFALIDPEGVFIDGELLCEFDKCLDRKSIVLGRDTEALFDIFLFYIFFLCEPVLVQDLSRIDQKFLPFRSYPDTAVRPPEDRDANLLLEFSDRGGEGGLGNEERLSRLID